MVARDLVFAVPARSGARRQAFGMRSRRLQVAGSSGCAHRELIVVSSASAKLIFEALGMNLRILHLDAFISAISFSVESINGDGS